MSVPEPAITVAAPHHGGSQKPYRVVIHTTESGSYPHASASGEAHDVALFFKNTSPYSAHYVTDNGGNVEHTVPEQTVAYHAPPNANSVGIEQCGAAAYTREQWLSPQAYTVLTTTAKLTAEVCDRWNIPKIKIDSADLKAGRGGISGHVDVSNAWHQTTHTDPGAGYPWDVFINLVLGVNSNPVPSYPVFPGNIGPKQGNKESIAQLQVLLTALGYSPGSNGVWTDQTSQAVEKLKKDHDIIMYLGGVSDLTQYFGTYKNGTGTFDPIVGSKTWQFMSWLSALKNQK